MKHMLRLTDYTPDEIREIFSLADAIREGRYENALKGKTVVMFFPQSGIRTRVSFEKGVFLLGGQTILFPPEALDKREELRDVAGYLNNWADALVIRHKNIAVIEEIARYCACPAVNAMTDVSHPCEILSDLYALSKIREDFTKDRYLFCGADGNIGKTWKEAAAIFGFPIEQCCAPGYEIEGVKPHYEISEAIAGKDIVCTDSLPSSAAAAFKSCRVTKAAMEKANPGALLNPCPPFYRGEEVSQDAIDSGFFVGYDFKENLLPVQQAILLYCMNTRNP